VVCSLQRVRLESVYRSAALAGAGVTFTTRCRAALERTAGSVDEQLRGKTAAGVNASRDMQRWESRNRVCRRRRSRGRCAKRRGSRVSEAGFDEAAPEAAAAMRFGRGEALELAAVRRLVRCVARGLDHPRCCYIGKALSPARRARIRLAAAAVPFAASRRQPWRARGTLAAPRPP
jgi:hypothetical protein